MGILRSEDMRHGTLVIPTERAVEIVSMLGNKGNLMIEDMNRNTMRRPYRRYIQRLEEMERMLRCLLEEIHKLPGASIEKDHIQQFLDYDGFVLEGVEESLKSLYDQFIKFRSNNDDLMKQRTRAMMERAVAQVAAKSLSGAARVPMLASSADGAGSSTQALLQTDPEAGGTTGFSSFAGVVLQADQDKLIRTLFRATRGNAYTHVEDLDEPFVDDSGQIQNRNVFVVYYQGGIGSAMHEKISRISKAFGIDSFPWPSSAAEAQQKIATLGEVIEDKTRALEAFEAFFFEEVAVLLQPIRPNGNSLIEDWRLFCQKQKALYGCLNLFEESEATLRADCWYPTEDEDNIRSLLSDFAGANTVSAFLLTDKSINRLNPPTYVKTTSFTEAFQNFVDTYGVPRYKEANPALLSIFTFPFLFGIMYGDIGHGVMIFFFGLYLCFQYNNLMKSTDEVTKMIAYGRYMILLMGICAVYCGFIYNDFFSLGIDMLGTRYKVKEVTGKTTEYEPDSSKTFPYPFGIDPIWKGADNELDFTNSFKMKAAVIVAFIQMLAGIVFKGMNAIYWKDQLTLWFEFLPELIFFVCFVGYMDFLIVYKWMSSYYGQPRASIISTLINMVMLKGVKAEDQFYAGQQKVELVLLILMVVSIPWMLFPKPIIAALIWKAKHPKGGDAGTDTISGAPAPVPAIEEETVPLGGRDEQRLSSLRSPGNESEGEGEMETEEFSFGEEMIHQVIETIEFVIGSISNTASYLRLWALSLAHNQLALVFFEQILLRIVEMVVKPNAGAGRVVLAAVAIFFGFGIFAGVTFGIMLCMDTLECYLHALRLHWVEFQNKFFKADGYKFSPFSFYRILAGIE